MRLYSFRMVGYGSNSDDPSALNEGPEFLPKADVRSTSASATGGRSVSTQTWLRIGLLFGSVFAEPDAPYILWLDQRGRT
jgi:hypothetical protein